MPKKPTYEELEKRVQELEQAESKRNMAMMSPGENNAHQPGGTLLQENDMGFVEFANIMDSESIQSMMDDFFKLTHIGGMAILDIHGNILVAAGWQDICTQFHRVHPETCKNCVESDVQLSSGVKAGTFKLYRCKNNMWDIATPIIVDGRHVGNLFLGQFLFSDEKPDMDVFRSQAQKYGFDEEAYIAAFERVPRMSRDTVNTVMSFYTKFARFISELSFDNVKLTRTLMERDRFLNALMESEKNLSITLNSIGDAVMATNRDGHIVRMNPVAERLTGWNEPDAIGKPLETVFNIINETSREAVESPVNKVLKEGVIVGIANHTVLISKEGKEIPVADSAAPIMDDADNVTGVVLVFRDQTEERTARKALEESQERFRTLHNASFGGIAIHDKGIILDCNQGLSEMTGFTGESLISMSECGLVAPEWREVVMQKILSGFEQPYEVEGLREDGSRYHLRIQGKSIPYHGRSVRVAEFRDITDLKCAERALLEKQRQLEALNQSLEDRIQEAVQELRRKDQMLIHQNRMAAMGEMIGNIAHQWRQPLNALGLLIANIKDAHQFNEMNDAYMDKAASDGYRLIQKMSTTISDFFNFFRPNKEIVAFSARRQIEETIALVQASFINNNIAIHFETVHDAKLLGFPNEYSQVLLNLLSNAKDAMLEHRTIEGRVDIHIEVIDNMGCVTVRDNAGGIPEEILGRIFDPYFTTKQRGIGIGLYMSQMIITDNMNGGIFARNVENGAEFTVSVPLASDSELDGRSQKAIYY